jgi:uncharacterized protein YeaC (DUF1315 family)
MTLDELINKMDPQMHLVVRQAVELGKWPNGDKLDAETKELCLQALIAYEAKNLPESARAGYINTEKLKKTQCDDHDHIREEEVNLNWVDTKH